MEKGWCIAVCEESINSRGAERVHLVSYTTDSGNKVYVDAWASKRFFKFEKLVPAEAPKPK